MDDHWLDELQRVRSEDRRFYERYVLGVWHQPEEKKCISDERLVALTAPRKAEFVSIEETLLMAFELVEARRRALLPPELIPNERVLELAESSAQWPHGTKILEPNAAYRDVAILLHELLSRRNQQ